MRVSGRGACVDAYHNDSLHQDLRLCLLRLNLRQSHPPNCKQGNVFVRFGFSELFPGANVVFVLGENRTRAGAVKIFKVRARNREPKATQKKGRDWAPIIGARRFPFFLIAFDSQVRFRNSKCYEDRF